MADALARPDVAKLLTAGVSHIVLKRGFQMDAFLSAVAKLLPAGPARAVVTRGCTKETRADQSLEAAGKAAHSRSEEESGDSVGDGQTESCRRENRVEAARQDTCGQMTLVRGGRGRYSIQ